MSVLTTIHRASTQAIHGLIDQIARIPLRVKNQARTLRAAGASSASTGPNIRERQEELVAFYERYEDLVELLCDGAQYGPDSRLEAKYADLRTWMQRHYPSLRRSIIAFLDQSVDDSTHSLDHFGHPADAFEALFAGHTLEEQIRTDDGKMISRMMRTRDALTRYAAQLRRLHA